MRKGRQTELAKAASMSQSTVTDLEKGKRKPMPNNLQAIRTALEAAGIDFTHENGGGLGVRLRDCA